MAWYRCGGESPTGNAIEAEVLAGKTFSNDDGTDKVGTMVNNGAVTQSLNTGRTSYTIPQGYHSGSGSVSITTQEKTATPTTSSQAITPDSGKVLSKVTVNAIQTQEKTVTAGTAAASVAPDSGKFLSRVTYNPTPTQEKTITASRSAQTVTPDSGKHLSKVTVNKYPDATGTYTYPANSTGGTYDMGAGNNLRYVNASNVYAKGKADGAPDTIKITATLTTPTSDYGENFYQTLSGSLSLTLTRGSNGKYTCTGTMSASSHFWDSGDSNLNFTKNGTLNSFTIS